MTPHTQNSKAWILFCYISFAVALGVTGIGIWAMEITLPMKAFLGMGLLFSTGSAFTLAKTLRDEHEASLFHHKLEDAKTERLLREVEVA
ncbi:MAG: YiaA/YiaB family inner membrane protein [Pseudomonadota bacterium]